MTCITIAFAGSALNLVAETDRARAIAEFLYLALPGAPARLRSDSEAPAEGPTLRLTNHPTDNSFELYDAHARLFATQAPGPMAECLQGEVCRRLAADSHAGLSFHAAAVARNGSAVAFPGMMQQGKSTLTAGLLGQGWTYLSDELLFVPVGTTRVYAFVRPLNLRRPVMHLFPHALKEPTPSPHRMNHDEGALLHPRLLGAADHAAEADLALLVFPHYQPAAPLTITPLTPARTGLALMECLVNARNLPEHGFREVTRLARAIPAYRLTYSSMAGVGSALAALHDGCLC